MQTPVERLVANKEATMNDVTCKSVARILFKLKEKYAMDMPIIEQLEAEIILTARLHFPQYPEYVTATQNFIKRCKEPVGELDAVTLMQNGNVQPVEKKIVFPLQEVLALVLRALKDNTAYTDHYPGGYKKKINSAWRDLPKRLETLYNFFSDINRCHTGLRNSLVGVLNHIYPEVDILEDATTAILSFSKDWLSQQFWQAWQEGDTAHKKILLDLLWQWMEQGDTTGVLAYLQEKDLFLNELSAFFLNHGIDFSTLTIGEARALQWTESILQSLEFPHGTNPHNYPLADLSFILGIAVLGLTEEQKNALVRVRNWIKENFQFDNTHHIEIVQLFRGVIENYGLLVKQQEFYRIFLKPAWIEEHIHLFQAYLNNISATCNAATLSAEGSTLTLKTVQSVATQIAQTYAGNEKPIIENFFANWFIKDSAVLAQHYVLLLNPSFCQRISWSDASMRNYQMRNKSQESDGSWSIELSCYEINRFFLHALVNPPATWSRLFSDNFAQVLTWVKAGFDQPENARAQALKDSSYPYELIRQMTYLLNESPFYSNRTPIPLNKLLHHPIKLPEQCKGSYRISSYFKLLHKHSHYQREFVRRLTLSEATFLKKIPDLLSGLQKHAPDFFELYVSDWQMIKNSITSFDTLKLYLKYLGSCFIEKYEDMSWAKTFILPDKLKETLVVISEQDRLRFLEKTFPDNLTCDYLSNVLEIINLLPLSAHYTFLLKVTNLSSLVKSMDNLKDLLRKKESKYSPLHIIEEGKKDNSKLIMLFDCVELARQDNDYEGIFKIAKYLHETTFNSLLTSFISRISFSFFIQRIYNSANLLLLFKSYPAWFAMIDDSSGWSKKIMRELKTSPTGGLYYFWEIVERLPPEQRYCCLKKCPEWPDLIEDSHPVTCINIINILKANEADGVKHLLQYMGIHQFFNLLKKLGRDAVSKLIDQNNFKEIIALLAPTKQVQLLKQLDLKKLVNSREELLDLLSPFNEEEQEEIYANTDIVWVTRLLQEDKTSAKNISMYPPTFFATQPKIAGFNWQMRVSQGRYNGSLPV